ncbi:MAG: hypothetical protein M1825_004268 [Sarcosagium campestre]|nr:MAG: hypothetical protein M1825_004268 [Sarcosagium campestre]
MPPGRVARQRVATTNENDENIGNTRVTRAKAAASVTSDDVSGVPVQKTLQTKKVVSTTTIAPTHNRRAALGDVSNVTKAEQAQAEARDVKKPTGIKKGLVSKASQNAGVQKASRPAAARQLQASKEANTKKNANNVLKRPASGSGVLGGVQKKRVPSAPIQPRITESAEEDADIDAQKRPEVFVESREELSVEIVASSRAAASEQVVATSKAVEPREAPASEVVQDLDSGDLDDPLMAAEYVIEIFDYLRSLEEKTLANANYIDHQEDLEWRMRGILIDWIIQVHARFRLAAETLFLAVNIIDRFLSIKVVQLDRLQLVGVTALFIASKYEDIINPDVAHLRNICDNGFKEDDILIAERFVLAALDYDLSYPNPMNFLRRISKADDFDIHTRTVGKYLLEISLLDHRFISYTPSLLSASAMYLSRQILERGEWHATIEYYAGYSEEEIEPIAKMMVAYLARPVEHDGFFTKYASKKFLKASILARQWAKKYAASYGVEYTDSRS